MRIGITGATGQLGQLVVQKLKEKKVNADFVALVRNPEKAKSLGIEARQFDYDQPENLSKALIGIDRLLLISGNEIGKRAEQHANVIDAAKEAGVKWIIYTSLLHADQSSISLATEHLATEQKLHESGIPFTLLRNGWYTENYTGNLKLSVEAGGLIGSAGNGKISSASREDYAEAAAVVISDDSHKGKTYELAGDQSFTLNDLAEEVSKVTGKQISYTNLSESEYTEELKKMGLPEELAKVYAGFDVSASKNDLFDDKMDLSKIIGRPTTPLFKNVDAALA
ncbi:SDR family oxidoreductase [Marinigracilibium pacificum]|uniref:SDR family oxidoreductase n=1 Tax=Marinigracilibium pacificum TaxID=2729599 RepID=A0A848J3K7_9BACT|nr:SDR family oxidoreductase [Marinigracilibium pacificum]NMM49908.1 SDR family oxidoreductase [Marinigracilibium pacificum]